MSKKRTLSKILIIFGLITIITALADLAVIILPPYLSNPEWTYGIGQQIADRSIIPILGAIISFIGFYINNTENGKLSFHLERSLGIFNVLFSIGLVFTILLYTLSMNAIQNNAVQALKEKRNNVVAEIDRISSQNQEVKKKADDFIVKLDSELNSKIKSTKKSLIKINFKTLVNLILFAFIYLFTGVLTIKQANLDLKKLKFKDKQ